MAAQSLSRSASQLAKPNLLLSFDAFGTLFSPKDPVAHQYLQEARQFGLTGFSEEELASKLYAAFKDESKLNPNYGKETGLGATKWWTNVSSTPGSQVEIETVLNGYCYRLFTKRLLLSYQRITRCRQISSRGSLSGLAPTKPTARNPRSSQR